MGYEEEGRPLRAEDPRGPEEVGLLSASGSITLRRRVETDAWTSVQPSLVLLGTCPPLTIQPLPKGGQCHTIPNPSERSWPKAPS